MPDIMRYVVGVFPYLFNQYGSKGKKHYSAEGFIAAVEEDKEDGWTTEGSMTLLFSFMMV